MNLSVLVGVYRRNSQGLGVDKEEVQACRAFPLLWDLADYILAKTQGPHGEHCKDTSARNEWDEVS